jgi:hypothetical protein
MYSPPSFCRPSSFFHYCSLGGLTSETREEWHRILKGWRDSTSCRFGTQLNPDRLFGANEISHCSVPLFPRAAVPPAIQNSVPFLSLELSAGSRAPLGRPTSGLSIGCLQSQLNARVKFKTFLCNTYY